MHNCRTKLWNEAEFFTWLLGIAPDVPRNPPPPKLSSLPRAAAPPAPGSPHPPPTATPPSSSPSTAVAEIVTGQGPCGVAAAVCSSDQDLVGRRSSLPARSVVVAWLDGDRAVVRQRWWRTAGCGGIGPFRSATRPISSRHRRTAPGFELQHEEAWGFGPRRGGGDLLLRRRRSASWLCLEWGRAATGESRAPTPVVAGGDGAYAPLTC